MNNSNQETSAEFGGTASSKEKKVIHFANGETLELEDSEEEEEEEEQSPNRGPFKEPAERTRFSFKNVAFLVGRISLLACDFLGERVAGVLGLNAAKYQYAIDQYHRDHKVTDSDVMQGQAETTNLSPAQDGSHYGATRDVNWPAHPQKSCDVKHISSKDGCHNRGYQEEGD
ncbi:protein FAM177A1 [Parambassis ranga]|uniref:Protein FAM177A1 n=1 Tax=Parambassis ranga TaxID=210632 RepID=A0A6P7HRT3_9TELE|nr:protein FAM177A1-like [Parambassis ranga]